MKNFLSKKKEAWKAHHEAFDCQHLTVKVSKRTIRGGAIQYVEQCQKCGQAVSSPMKREVALKMCDGREPEPFDQSIFDAYSEQIAKSVERIHKEFDKSAFHEDYGSYLASAEWRAKRQLVLKRSGGVCEGCGINQATEVHHLTYANVGQEFLFELVAICEPCHERLHEEKQ